MCLCSMYTMMSFYLVSSHLKSEADVDVLGAIYLTYKLATEQLMLKKAIIFEKHATVTFIF